MFSDFDGSEYAVESNNEIPQTLISRVWFLHKPTETWLSSSLGVATQQQLIEYSPNTVNETRANVIYSVSKGEKGFAATNRDLISIKDNPNVKIETEQLRCETCLALLTACFCTKGEN